PRGRQAPFGSRAHLPCDAPTVRATRERRVILCWVRAPPGPPPRGPTLDSNGDVLPHDAERVQAPGLHPPAHVPPRVGPRRGPPLGSAGGRAELPRPRQKTRAPLLR